MAGDKQPKTGNTRLAIDYMLNQWSKLIQYCVHGDLNVSNVLVKNAIRPFVVGRKNWLFTDTPAGANASALYYSLIEAAKTNNVEPFTHLNHVIGNIGTIADVETVERYEALLPWNMS